MALACDHPWFQLISGKGWCCTVCGFSRYGFYPAPSPEKRIHTIRLCNYDRAAAIDEAVRRWASVRTKGLGGVGREVYLQLTALDVEAGKTTVAVNRIRAEFARIMSQDDLESAGNGMGMR